MLIFVYFLLAVDKYNWKHKGRQFKIPEMKTIFSIKSGPFANESLVKSWVSEIFEYSLMSKDRLDHMLDITMFVPFFYPFCTNKERYELLIKYFLAYFI